MRRVFLLLPIWAALSCTPAAQEEVRDVLLVPVGAEYAAPAGAEGARIVRVEVADRPASRERGLMHRESLAPDAGMLFVYPDEPVRGFWMKNTRIPLSIAYLSSDRTIVRIRDMEPGWGRPDGSLTTYPSDAPARYALEMEQGWFRRNGVAEGDRLGFHPALLEIRGE